MAGTQRIKQLLYLDTYGWIAVACLLIAALTGVFLVIPYDVNAPYESLTRMLISNAPASYVRNLHYWSAQFFLIFSILHLYDHFKRSTENNIRKRGVWLRLTISLAFLFYVMISGFILKADNDSQQARRILSTLFESIPLAGNLLQRTFIGPENNWQIIYIQHVATATIILFLSVFEHARTIWVKVRTFVIVLFFICVLSAFLRAPLSNLNENVMKGPWYFIGLQEILHWISFPWMIMAVTFLIALVIFFIPKIREPWRVIVKKGLLALLVTYGILTATGFFFRGENWHLQWPWQQGAVLPFAKLYNPFAQSGLPYDKQPTVQGRTESCLLCHSGMKGLSESHSEASTGCYACHLGDPFSADKRTAHRGMEMVPGNLKNASKTCGTANCHPQIVARVNTGLMATLSGMITVDRFVFGEVNDLDALSTVHGLGFTAADRHLRNLCVGCHLGNEKTKHGPAEWLERGGGCNACHLTYHEDARKDLAFQQNKRSSDTTPPACHPTIDLNVNNDKCLSCHSRSGRISMNYEGWHETPLKTIPQTHTANYRKLPDGRIFEFIGPDIHHQKGMSCIDCHGSYELMGDGQHHAHKEESVKVQCADCHPERKSTNSTAFEQTDRETQLIAWLRKYETRNVYIVKTQKGALPLVNTTVDPGGQVTVTTKLSGQKILSKPQHHYCNRGNVHDRLSCNACHTAWAPQCIGCHNSYERQTAGFDMLRNIPTKGTWVEYSGVYLSDEPVLGIDEKSGKSGQVQTMVPGMIMTIDKASFSKNGDKVFHRLYAPASAHTTRRESRSCKSCHNNPLAIGFGRGSLVFSSAGRWTFEPKYERHPNDSLPEDAWTGFLKNRSGIVSTRKGIRPFNVDEQKRILTAGACLTCHDENSAIMTQSLTDFSKLVNSRSTRCVMPVW